MSNKTNNIQLKNCSRNNRGFILAEMVMAYAFWVLVFPTLIFLWFSYVYKGDSIDKKATNIVRTFSEGIYNQQITSYIDRGIAKLSVERLEYISTDWQDAFGRNSCRGIGNGPLTEYTSIQLDVPERNAFSAVAAQGHYLYVATNSSSTTDPDIHVVDIANIRAPVLVSSLQTGPGLNSIQVAGSTAYVGNTSSLTQVQAVDITNSTRPQLKWSFGVPGANSSTSPITKSLYYYAGYIVLGVEKTVLPELYIIDIHTSAPKVIDSMEMGTSINALAALRNNVFLLSPADLEIQVYDISTGKFVARGSYDAEGHLGNGKRIDVFNNELYFGRTVGGEELQVLTYSMAESSTSTTTTSTTSPSGEVAIQPRVLTKLKSSVDSVLGTKDTLFVLSADPSKEFQVWKKAKNAEGQIVGLQSTQSFDLPARASMIACHNEYVFVVLPKEIKVYSAQQP